MSNQLLGAIHVPPVLHCDWCKGGGSQKGGHFPSDLEELGRNEEQAACLPAPER